MADDNLTGGTAEDEDESRQTPISMGVSDNESLRSPTTFRLGSPARSSSSTPPTQSSYNPDQAHDLTRTHIAWALLALTAAIVVGAFIMSAWALSSTARIKDNLATVLALLNVIFGPIIALLGSVIGFYFGSRAATGPTKI